jgi:GNAT superfamily N-acetyltransferase
MALPGSERVRDIEEALFAHWSLFGRPPTGALHDADGLLWFETPITRLPYNGVIRTRLGDGAAADAAIAAAVERFRARGVEFLWFDHPSATPSDLGERLAAHGLRPAERIACMALDLRGLEPPAPTPGVVFREVLDDADVEAYSGLTIRYWEIPEREQHLVGALHRAWGTPGIRYLAELDGAPVGKGYLSLAGPAGVAALFGMSVRPEARRRGVAAGLTATLLRRAIAEGCTRAVLHSTAMAAGVYRRAGFVEQCPLTIYATTPLWSHDDDA